MAHTWNTKHGTRYKAIPHFQEFHSTPLSASYISYEKLAHWLFRPNLSIHSSPQHPGSTLTLNATKQDAKMFCLIAISVDFPTASSMMGLCIYDFFYCP